MLMSDQSVRFAEAARRAAEWSIAQQKEDGSITPPEQGANTYYKSPYAFAVTGHPTEANRLLDWTKANALFPGGELKLTSNALALYKHSWMLQGAIRLGRFDLVMPLGDYILRCMAPCGGFFQVPQGNEFVEPACTGWGGMAMVYIGQLELARKAGDAIGLMLDQQPDPNRLYCLLTPRGELIAGDNDTFIDFTQKKQVYWRAGIPFLFLMRLYLATSDPRYLDMGQRIFDMQHGGASDAFSHPASGKSGLAAAILYSITGDQRARDAAYRQADFLLSIQNADGWWSSAGPSCDDLGVKLDHTGEFTVFLTEMAAVLGSREW